MVLRNAEGAIAYGETSCIDRVDNGEEVAFEVYAYETPEHASFEIYARDWQEETA